MMAGDKREFLFFITKEFNFHTELEMLASTTYNDANKC